MANRNSLALFSYSVNQLIESSLIMVDKHIAQLLKVVANEPVLTKVLRETLQTTSYVTEFSRAKVVLTRPDGKTESKLKLPNDRNKLFSFVVCLLLEIDGGKRQLIEFLKDFYYDADSNVSFLNFVNSVLRPFKTAGESILKSIDPESFDEGATTKAENYFYGENIYIGTEQMNTMLSAIQEIREIVENAGNLQYVDKVECLTMCDTLVNALHLKNPKIITFCWIGFKNTVKVLPQTSKQVVLLFQLLQSLPK